MSKLYDNIVTRTKNGINLMPESFIMIGTERTTSPCSIDECTFRLIKDGIALRAPTPHSVFFPIFILSC